MIVIRLFRAGKKHQPFFKVVVTDKRNPPSAGRFVEEVGFYNPITKEKTFKKERIHHWISKGAKLSDTIHNLFITEKIIEGKKIPKHNIVKKKEEVAETTTEVPKEAVVEKPKQAEVAKTKESTTTEQPATETPKEEPKDEQLKPKGAQQEEIKQETETQLVEAKEEETKVDEKIEEKQEAPVTEEPKQ